MIKVEKDKYNSGCCSNCHRVNYIFGNDVKTKVKNIYQITIRNKYGMGTQIELCDVCLEELQTQLKEVKA